jgi:hypothetical protein
MRQQTALDWVLPRSTAGGRGYEAVTWEKVWPHINMQHARRRQRCWIGQSSVLSGTRSGNAGRRSCSPNRAFQQSRIPAYSTYSHR